jgi:hypothetical protein
MESSPPANPLILDHDPGASLPSRDPFVSLKASNRRGREDTRPEAYSIWDNQGKSPARPRDDKGEKQAPGTGERTG